MKRMRKLFLGFGFFIALLFAGNTAAAQGVPTGTPHQATITWTAPSPVGGSGTVSGYNIYRSPSTGTANYVKLNTTPIVGLTSTDTTVTAGTSYNYCVSTVDSLSEESACSTPVLATIPTNPNAPSVTVTVK
jgi:fibronectin type 3 domain-containing protein